MKYMTTIALLLAAYTIGLIQGSHTIRIEHEDETRALEDCTTQVQIASAALTLANATFTSMGAPLVHPVSRKVNP